MSHKPAVVSGRVLAAGGIRRRPPRLGALEGGDKGQAMVANATGWLTGHGVKRPDRMIAMLAPGFA